MSHVEQRHFHAGLSGLEPRAEEIYTSEGLEENLYLK